MMNRSLILLVLATLFQEPATVKITNPDVVPYVYSMVFNPKEMQQAKKCSYLIKAEIKSNGRVSNLEIRNLDSSTIVFKRKDYLIREFEKRLKIEIYSEALRQRIKKSNSPFCISLLISKGAIFDYENHPFKCNSN